MPKYKLTKGLLTSPKAFPFDELETVAADMPLDFGLPGGTHDEDGADEHYTKFEAAFVEAIGQNGEYKKISPDIKTRFAGNIYAEIGYIQMTGEDHRAMHDYKVNLLKKAQDLQAFLTDFLLYQRQVRSHLKSITLLQRCLVEDSPGSPLNAAWWQLYRYQEFLRRIKTSAKRGPSNKVELHVATYIAEQFQNHLGVKPATAKPPQSKTSLNAGLTKPTPFDRVCSLVAEALGIKIANSTKIAAIAALR